MKSINEDAPRGTADETDLVESRIQQSERALGIQSEAERLQEASLLVDKVYLDTAVIIGETAGAERAFGHEEWAGHLGARLLAREYGKRPLTIDFMLDLHRCYIERIDSGAVGELRDGNPANGTGGYIDGEYIPFFLPDSQAAVIKNNPWIDFVPDAKPDSPRIGKLRYPCMSKREGRAALQALCDWYNSEIQNPQHNPYWLAKGLQEQFVSLHPLEGGVNGRPSRALMNWSLENAGEPPSAPSDFNNDILTSPQEWQRQVAAGSRQYAALGKLIVAGETNPVVLFGLEREETVYEKALSQGGKAPPSLLAGENHDARLYMQFLSKVRLGVERLDSPRGLLKPKMNAN